MPTPPPTGPLVTRDTLATQLRALGVEPGETLLMHSSLSSLGMGLRRGRGGRPRTFRHARSGRHTGRPHADRQPLGPGSVGKPAGPRGVGGGHDPGHHARVRPPRHAQPRGRRDPGDRTDLAGALRSAHPQTSFAAVGPRAAEIIEGHAPDCRLGEHSPLARLETLHARVLLLGAGYDACTSFHLAEYRIPAPRVKVGRPGPVGWEVVTEVSIDSDRVRRAGARLRAGPSRRTRTGGRGRRTAVPGGGGGGVRGAVAGGAPVARGGGLRPVRLAPYRPARFLYRGPTL